MNPEHDFAERLRCHMSRWAEANGLAECVTHTLMHRLEGGPPIRHLAGPVGQRRWLVVFGLFLQSERGIFSMQFTPPRQEPTPWIERLE